MAKFYSNNIQANSGDIQGAYNVILVGAIPVAATVSAGSTAAECISLYPDAIKNPHMVNGAANKNFVIMDM